MIKRLAVFVLLVFMGNLASAQWTQWRGSADGQGVIDGKSPVTEWSKSRKVIILKNDTQVSNFLNKITDERTEDSRI